MRESARTAQARASLRAWILEQNGKVRADQLRDDTPLLEERIITSLVVADLILFIESLRGEPVDFDLLNGAALRSVDAIVATFLTLDEVGHA